MHNSFRGLFQPLDPGGASEAIVRRIGGLIGAGELRPSDRLPAETSLAEAFGVAPMTVRAALQILRQYGVLETRRGRNGGTFVCSDAVMAPYFEDPDTPSLKSFEDFTAWRVAVSGEASFLAASRFAAGTLGDEAALRLRDLAAPGHGLDLSSARLADAGFHLYIAELAGSPSILEAERSIQSQLTRVLRRMLEPVDPGLFPGQSHEPLADAILDGRSDDARSCLRIHARSTVDLMAGVGYLR